MPILTKPAFGPQTALTYITAGGLALVWTLVWYFTRDDHYVLNSTGRFLVIGFIVSGFLMIVLGFFLGPIGRAARQAELPPVEATRHEAEIQRAAVAAPPAAPVAAAPPAAAVPVAPAAPPAR